MAGLTPEERRAWNAEQDAFAEESGLESFTPTGYTVRGTAFVIHCDDDGHYGVRLFVRPDSVRVFDGPNLEREHTGEIAARIAENTAKFLLHHFPDLSGTVEAWRRGENIEATLRGGA